MFLKKFRFWWKMEIIYQKNGIFKLSTKFSNYLRNFQTYFNDTISQTTLAVWLPDMDSNHDKEIQNLRCCHYTIGQIEGWEIEAESDRVKVSKIPL